MYDYNYSELVQSNASSIPGAIGRELAGMIINTAGKYVSNIFKQSGVAISITNPNDSTKLMYRIVDNSTPYEEMLLNRSKMEFEFKLSIDRRRNPSDKNNGIGYFVKNILKK